MHLLLSCVGKWNNFTCTCYCHVWENGIISHALVCCIIDFNFNNVMHKVYYMTAGDLLETCPASLNDPHPQVT